MGASFIIIYSITIVVAIIILFLVGLFTHLSPSFILIMMYVFLLANFIIAAGYAADAAAKTGGKNADEANKKASSYYNAAAILSWLIVGAAAIVIIAGILIAIFGGGEASAGAEAAAGTEAALGAEAASAEAGVEKAASETAKTLSKEGINKEEATIASKAVSNTPEGKEIAKKLEKEQKQGKSIFDTGQGFSKWLHYILYLMLGLTIALALTVGLLLAIGASIQGGSDNKAGLKKASIAASINLFIGGMYVIFFIVMYFRGRNLHKRLEEDLAKQEALTRTYLQQRQAGVAQAKGQYVGNLLVHNLGLNQPTYIR